MPGRPQGIVLAGGQSRRFGRDKALAVIDGKPMLARAVSLLLGLKLPVAVVTASGRTYPFLDCPVLEDLQPGLGPLGGLLTASRHFQDSPLLVLTCDMPRVTLAAAARLIQEHETGASATVFVSARGPEPFPGIYSPSAGEHAAKLLRGDLPSMRSLLETLSPPPRLLAYPCGEEAFLNVNRASDLP